MIGIFQKEGYQSYGQAGSVQRIIQVVLTQKVGLITAHIVLIDVLLGIEVTLACITQQGTTPDAMDELMSGVRMELNCH